MGWLGQKPGRKDGNSRTVFGKGRGAEKWGSSWMVIQELKKGLFCLLHGSFFFSPLINFIKHFQIYSKSEDKAQSSYITPPTPSPHGLGWFFVFQEVGQGVC